MTKKCSSGCTKCPLWRFHGSFLICGWRGEVLENVSFPLVPLSRHHLWSTPVEQSEGCAKLRNYAKEMRTSNTTHVVTNRSCILGCNLRQWIITIWHDLKLLTGFGHVKHITSSSLIEPNLFCFVHGIQPSDKQLCNGIRFPVPPMQPMQQRSSKARYKNWNARTFAPLTLLLGQLVDAWGRQADA